MNTNRKLKKTTLQNKTIVITGGARGIGLATTSLLAEHGAQVVITDMDAALAEQEASNLCAQGYSVSAHALDVRDRAQINSTAQALISRFGKIDVWVNNAGIMPMGAFEQESPETTDAQISINLRGVIDGCQAVLPHMLERKQGVIVNVASLAGRFPLPGAAVYSATKHAVVGLSDALREEYRNTGVSVSCVMPSKVLTELSSGTNEGKLIPAVSPEAVAEGILHAITTKTAEVVVPKKLTHLAGVYNLLPKKLTTVIRRAADDHRILNKMDLGERTRYLQRLKRIVDTTK